MAGIPKRFIRDIIDMTDIISLVEKYVPLKKKGKDHWGLCPFCEDGKNPSFSVSQQKQFYYCFKCRSTGNVIGFLEQYSGLNFVESIETLASLNSIEVPYEDSPKRAEGREDIYDALDKATIFYESYLSNEASAEKVRKYLNEERKLSGKVCRHFSIGYAPSSWDALTDHLVQKGIKEEVLINAGLSKRNKKGDLYDIFRDRLMFPIKDRKGRTVGFGGRVMNPEDQPKYLNTGETLVFQKGKELYGLYESSLNRRDITKIFVVEGYVDVVAMFDKGLENSVATLGIATNRFHVQKLLQIVDEIVFCFDGDDAGRGAAWGALKNALPAINDGAELKFLFPESEFENFISSYGNMPLPPYIQKLRKPDKKDFEDYQTIFANNAGSVAAPTAGLHFSNEIMNYFYAKNQIEQVTLHVGAGTFLPVRVDNVEKHEMHTEWGEVKENVAASINRTKNSGGNIIPVGTTSLRLLETAATPNGQVSAFSGETNIFITPGYEFKVTDKLITNFHLPKSTLFMLVAAFSGLSQMHTAYKHAIKNQYRFYSYGDACLLNKQKVK